MDCIKHLLAPHVEEIDKAENTNVALVFKMYQILKEFLIDVIHMNYGGPNSQLVILGGIMINTYGKGSDMFLPICFEKKTKDGQVQSVF